jgi:hypothetical protein
VFECVMIKIVAHSSSINLEHVLYFSSFDINQKRNVTEFPINFNLRVICT